MVNDLLQGLGLGGQGGGAATPAQGVEDPNKYQPPAHGTNPHGQGTVITEDFLPSTGLPYSGDPAGGEDCPNPTACEEVVIGRSRGEQNNPYHGHVTIISLFGNELPPGGVDTDPGESEEFGPLIPLFTPICEESQGMLCLGLLEAQSTTTENSSHNHFRFFGLSSQSDLGHLGINLFESNGNIEGDSTCQRSEGNSEVASVSAGSNGTDLRQNGSGVEGSVMSSSSESQACNNAPPTQTNDSSVLAIDGEESFPVCEEETLINFGLIALGCNNDDTNGVGEQVQQAPVPYGVREAFNVFILPFFLFPEDGGLELRQLEDPPLALLKSTAAASESHAVAPPPPPTQPLTPPSGAGAGGQAGQQGPGGGPGDEGPGGPVAEEAGPGEGDLAFTGSDLLVLGLIGVGLVMAGLTTTRLAVRHHRATS